MFVGAGFKPALLQHTRGWMEGGFKSRLPHTAVAEDDMRGLRYFGYLASSLLAVAIMFALASVSNAPSRAAEGDLKVVRATLSRSLSAPFIWGFNPIGEKYGLRTQVLDAI